MFIMCLLSLVFAINSTTFAMICMFQVVFDTASMVQGWCICHGANDVTLAKRASLFPTLCLA